MINQKYFLYNRIVNLSVLFFILIFVIDVQSIDTGIKNIKSLQDEIESNNQVLYVSRHDGTISNFSEVAKFLNLNVTILKPSYGYTEKPSCYVEDKCESFVESMCSKYNYIVISDIIPDSYIYITNVCKSKIILEITNRFNLCIPSKDKKEYHEMFSNAISENDNLVVVENNPYEIFHACLNNVFIKNYYLIRPIGYAPQYLLQNVSKKTHNEIAIISRFHQDRIIAIPRLKRLHIKFTELEKDYGGPLVLASYKAVIFFPYQVSIMKMMENFRYGVATILPSEKLFTKLCKKRKYHFPEKSILKIPNGVSNYIEFYNKEFKDLFVYFDKWRDLPKIIRKTDFNKVKIKSKEFMIKYEKKQLNLWRQAFGILPPKDIFNDTNPICN